MNWINSYVIVRTYSAGCFAGRLVSREGKECELADARRLWFWAGAASLSELASRGTSKPAECKFPAPVESVILTEVIEVLSVSDTARKSIEEMRKLQKDALGQQETFAGALGKFLSNNPTLPQGDVAKWTKFAEDQGRTGVTGGAAGVLSALSDLRGATAGSSEADQMAAMAEAVKR